MTSTAAPAIADHSADPDRIDVLRDYAAGRVGTREAIRHAGLADYADLVIALARNDLGLPKPSDTPRRRAHLERASAILQPLLRHER